MKRLDKPLITMLIVALAYGWFIVALRDARNGDISRFVVAGGPGVDAARVPPGLTVTKTPGFDGAIYYRLALDPFPREATAYGITLDNPPYRAQRIGYPLLVWLLSFGHAPWVPALLVIVNWMAAIAMAGLGAALSRHWGHHALWGLLVPMYPGFALSLSRDLTEPVASAFVVAAAWAVIVKKRPVVAALLLTYAILTRETSLVFAVAIAAAYGLQRIARRETSIAPVLFALPIGVFIAWQFVLAQVWGVAPIRSGDGVPMGAPFVAYWQFLKASLPRRVHLQRLYFAESLYWGLVVLSAAVSWWRSRVALEWRLAWLAYLGLAATLGSYFWYDDFGFMRIFADLFVVSAILILAAGPVQRWLTVLASCGLWVYVAQHLIDVR